MNKKWSEFLEYLSTQCEDMNMLHKRAWGVFASVCEHFDVKVKARSRTRRIRKSVATDGKKREI